jgi:hypothetical protein
MKVCTKCKKNKDETCFSKQSKSKDGLQSAICSAAGATGSKHITNFHTLESIKIIIS